MGQDVSEVPCLRSSLLTGIGGGVAVGLGHFLITSRPKRAMDMAVFSFVGITTSFW